jgi:hypothetical protein
MNELVIYWIIVSSDLGDIGGLGLIINFSSAMLICQLDDILFDSSRVHNLLEYFNGIENTNNEFLDIKSIEDNSDSQSSK